MKQSLSDFLDFLLFVLAPPIFIGGFIVAVYILLGG